MNRALILYVSRTHEPAVSELALKRPSAKSLGVLKFQDSSDLPLQLGITERGYRQVGRLNPCSHLGRASSGKESDLTAQILLAQEAAFRTVVLSS